MVKVALLYGGTSAEHDVSVMSAKNVRPALVQAGFEVVPIFISRSGEWQLEGSEIKGRELMMKLPELCDVAFPITHGTYGEDGSLQGLFDMLQVAYVGCDVVSSAVCFDKEITKRILHDDHISVVDYTTIGSATDKTFEELKTELGAPLFVKPTRQGSSLGVSKVTNAEELARAVEVALRYGKKVLIERASTGREIEFAVLEENGQLTISSPGEIAVPGGFYDYDAKYTNDDAELKIPTELSDDELTRGRKMVEQAFRALNCRGMARVDCFLEDGEWLINEINTIPGFTDVSMYPKLLEHDGISQSELVKRLVTTAHKKIV
jgi:D-alanine-D-alanine ligase